MKLKVLLVGALLAISSACVLVPNNPSTIILEAQTLPITKTVAWDASLVDANHAAPDNYVVKLDNTQVGTPTVLTQAVTFTTAGSHDVSVQAQSNLWGLSSAAVLHVIVNVPNPPSNLRLQ